MISVIIPTLWFNKDIQYMIPKILESNSVGELIIIDNAPHRCPELPESNKLIILKQDKNQFVNSSWKIGIDQAKYDNICIAEDDIVWNCDIFDKIDPIFNSNTVLGISEADFELHTNLEEAIKALTPTPKIKTHSCKKIHYFWGQIIFIHKSKFIQPPPEFRIYMGDNVIFYGNLKNNVNVKELVGFRVLGKYADSIFRPIFQHIVLNELKNIHKLVDEYKIDLLDSSRLINKVGKDYVSNWRLYLRE